jgi:glutamate-1-semialdehyde 2,1-aminomutase
VVPDLVTLGKTMGGGFPIAAFAGKRSFMERIRPTGDTAYDVKNVVYHSGTYNSNPLSLTAVKASVEKLKDGKVHEKVNKNGQTLRTGIAELMDRYDIKGTTTGYGSILQCYFGVEGRIRNLKDTLGANRESAARFHSSLLKKGIFFIATPRGFVSAAHEAQDIERTLEAVEITFREMTGKA